LDRATWHNLPQEDKAKWDTLSPEGKNAIIAGTHQRGVEIASSSTSVKPKPKMDSTDTAKAPSIKNTRSVSFAPTGEIASNPESINTNVTESSKNPNTEVNLAHSEDQKILVNLAKSHLPVSDIRMLLSQVSTKTTKRSQDKKSNYSANFHDTQLELWSQLVTILLFGHISDCSLVSSFSFRYSSEIPTKMIAS
jgi:hypothetical protein